MNKNQRVLYNALIALSNGVLVLEDALNISDILTKNEIQEVVNKFSNKIVEFNIKELFQDSYCYETYANTILTNIAEKLNIDY